MTFVEIPPPMVQRTNDVPQWCVDYGEAGGVRIFDAPVADGIVRAVITFRPILLFCLGHRASFHDGNWRNSRRVSAGEIEAGLAHVRALLPDLPELVQVPDARVSAIIPGPAAAFVEKSQRIYS